MKTWKNMRMLCQLCVVQWHIAYVMKTNELFPILSIVLNLHFVLLVSYFIWGEKKLQRIVNSTHIFRRADKFLPLSYHLCCKQACQSYCRKVLFLMHQFCYCLWYMNIFIKTVFSFKKLYCLQHSSFINTSIT